MRFEEELFVLQVNKLEHHLRYRVCCVLVIHPLHTEQT